jgi:hypothetical protein
MNRRSFCAAAAGAAALLCILSAARPAQAAEAFYVDWTAADVAGGTATGVINIPGEDAINVNFKATFANGDPGNLVGAQVDGTGTDFWNPETPYISSAVENAPPGTDILRLQGGVNQIYTVTFSEAIAGPVMALVSLGAGGTPITYEFDQPFDIVSQAAGFFGGGSDRLQELPNNVLGGNEGHGTVVFEGEFSEFSWTVPDPEFWHGFTFGVRGVGGGTNGGGNNGGEPVIPLPAASWMALSLLGGLGGFKAIRRRLMK